MASSIYAIRIINNATSNIEDHITQYKSPVDAGFHIKIGIKKPGGIASLYVRKEVAEAGSETCVFVNLEDLEKDNRRAIGDLGLRESSTDIKGGGVVVAKITTIFKS